MMFMDPNAHAFRPDTPTSTPSSSAPGGQPPQALPPQQPGAPYYAFSAMPPGSDVQGGGPGGMMPTTTFSYTSPQGTFVPGVGYLPPGTVVHVHQHGAGGAPPAPGGGAPTQQQQQGMFASQTPQGMTIRVGPQGPQHHYVAVGGNNNNRPASEGGSQQADDRAASGSRGAKAGDVKRRAAGSANGNNMSSSGRGKSGTPSQQELETARILRGTPVIRGSQHHRNSTSGSGVRHSGTNNSNSNSSSNAAGLAFMRAGSRLASNNTTPVHSMSRENAKGLNMLDTAARLADDTAGAGDSPKPHRSPGAAPVHSIGAARTSPAFLASRTPGSRTTTPPNVTTAASAAAPAAAAAAPADTETTPTPSADTAAIAASTTPSDTASASSPVEQRKASSMKIVRRATPNQSNPASADGSVRQPKDLSPAASAVIDPASSLDKPATTPSATAHADADDVSLPPSLGTTAQPDVKPVRRVAPAGSTPQEAPLAPPPAADATAADDARLPHDGICAVLRAEVVCDDADMKGDGPTIAAARAMGPDDVHLAKLRHNSTSDIVDAMLFVLQDHQARPASAPPAAEGREDMPLVASVRLVGLVEALTPTHANFKKHFTRTMLSLVADATTDARQRMNAAVLMGLLFKHRYYGTNDPYQTLVDLLTPFGRVGSPGVMAAIVRLLSVSECPPTAAARDLHALLSASESSGGGKGGADGSGKNGSKRDKKASGKEGSAREPKQSQRANDSKRDSKRDSKKDNAPPTQQQQQQQQQQQRQRNDDTTSDERKKSQRTSRREPKASDSHHPTFTVEGGDAGAPPPDLTRTIGAATEEKNTTRNVALDDAGAFERNRARTVYITRIDPNMTEGALRELLLLCGDFDKVRLCGSTPGRCKYAFVEFSSTDGARLMLRRDQSTFGSLQLKVSAAKSPIETDDPRDALFDATRGKVRACVFGLSQRVSQASASGKPMSSSAPAAPTDRQFQLERRERTKALLEDEDRSAALAEGFKQRRDRAVLAKSERVERDRSGVTRALDEPAAA